MTQPPRNSNRRRRRTRSTSLTVILLAVGLFTTLLFSSCRTIEEPQEMNTLERVRSVLKDKRAGLMEKYQAQGVGIGKESLEDEEYVIVVYVESPSQTKSSDSIDGIPVIFRNAGRISPLNNQ